MLRIRTQFLEDVLCRVMHEELHQLATGGHRVLAEETKRRLGNLQGLDRWYRQEGKDMPLNLRSNPDLVPRLRWMATTGQWRVIVEGVRRDIELKEAVFDLERIETGWGLFAAGGRPQWVWDSAAGNGGSKPDDGRDWKRGFKLSVLSEGIFGGNGLAELATTSRGATIAIEELYNAQFEREADKHKGQVPLVRFEGSEERRVGRGKTRVPTLKIVKWLDRPQALKNGHAVR